ncbi:aldehyde dehydrogenase, partial [Pseudomonas aeruginosa]
ALVAAHAASDASSRTSVHERSTMLLNIADSIEQNLQLLAVTESRVTLKDVRLKLTAHLTLPPVEIRNNPGRILAQER